MGKHIIKLKDGETKFSKSMLLLLDYFKNIIIEHGELPDVFDLQFTDLCTEDFKIIQDLFTDTKLPKYKIDEYRTVIEKSDIFKDLATQNSFNKAYMAKMYRKKCNFKFDKPLNMQIWQPVEEDYKKTTVTYTDKDTGEPVDEFMYQENPKAYNKTSKNEKMLSFRLYGITSGGKSICLTVTGFVPYFYIKLPKIVRKKEIIDNIMSIVKSRMDWASGGLRRHKREKRQDVLYFRDGKKDMFLKIWCASKQAYNKCIKTFKQNNNYQEDKVTYQPGDVDDWGNEKPAPWYIHLDGITEPGKPLNLKLYESNLPPLLRFSHMAEAFPGGWITVPPKSLSPECILPSNTQLNVQLNDWTKIKKLDKDEIGAAIVAAYDIECTSAGGFPQSGRPTDMVIQIATLFQRVGEPEPFLKHIITLKQSDPIDGCIVESYKTEKQVLVGWTKLITKMDPDILTGYNTFGFDDPYLFERAKLNKVQGPFMKLSRVYGQVCKLKRKEMKSNAYGFNEWKYLDMTGRISIDLLAIIKREYKLPSYRLDYVVKDLLKRKEAKIDLKPAEIFEGFERGTPQDIKRIGEYCIMDVQLCLDLIFDLNILSNMVEMAKVTMVPIDFLVFRGQQIKVFSQILYEARLDGYCVPASTKQSIDNYADGDDENLLAEEDDTFVGATVLEPVVGAYGMKEYDKRGNLVKDDNEPVTVLDFMSLYPTIMIAWNLCYSTLVKHDKYKNLPGYKYRNVEVEDKSGNIETHTFILPDNGQQRYKGLLPKILENLLAARKRAKGDLKSCNAKLKEMMKNLENGEYEGHTKEEYINMISRQRMNSRTLDGRQLALKISCNSVYGFTGTSSTGMLSCRPISSSTTTIGREMIEFTKNKAELDYPGSKVVYGDTDSVFVKFKHDPSWTKQQCLDYSFKHGNILADACTDSFRHPIVLEYEKMYLPFLLYKKKRYAALMWENTDKPKYIDCKGLETVRRDNADVVKEVLNTALDALMNHRDPKLAIDNVRKILRDLQNGSIDMNLLKISTSLKDTESYKNPHSIASWVLAQRMKERDPGNYPKAGSRMYYVFVENPKAKKNVDRVEDPTFVQENPDKCKIDTLFYLDKQIIKPLTSLMELVVDNPHNIYKDIRIEMENKKHGRRPITDFFKISK